MRAVKPGLRFHGLRVSHKIWLMEDGVPEIAQKVRLGHAMRGRLDPVMRLAPWWEQEMLEALQARFTFAVEHACFGVRAFLAELTGDRAWTRRSAA